MIFSLSLNLELTDWLYYLDSELWAPPDYRHVLLCQDLFTWMPLKPSEASPPDEA